MSGQKLAILICLVCLAPSARADDREAARTHYRAGTHAYETGHFDEAVREYLLAYRFLDDPAILYNIAQAHRLAKHPSEALHFYRMFLVKAPDASNREEVQARVEALQQLVKLEEEREPPPTAPKAGSAQSGSAQSAANLTAPPNVVAPPIVVAQPAPDHRRKTAAVATLVTGLALVVTGVALTAAAYSGAHEYDHPSSTTSFDPDALSRIHVEQGIGAAALGIGAAVTVAGAVLFAVASRHAHALSAASAARGFTVSF